MIRYRILLFVGLVTVFALSSCATTEKQEAAVVSSGDVILKDLGNGVCRQLPAGLMWQIKPSEVISTKEEADAYAKGLQLAGFDDWRLPTSDECLMLSELVAMNKGDCPIKKVTKGYWVSSGKKGKSGFWDDEHLICGPEFLWVKSKQGYVRAVRP